LRHEDLRNRFEVWISLFPNDERDARIAIAAGVARLSKNHDEETRRSAGNAAIARDFPQESASE
jgi:hypothetical protein